MPSSSRLFALVGLVAMCLLAGASGAGLIEQAMRGWFLSLAAPAGMAPVWVFVPAWAVLSVLVGVAAWLVWLLPAYQSADKRAALQLWGWQMLLGALWVPAFFGLHNPLLGVMVGVPLVALVALTLTAFARLRPIAAALLVPYLAGICYVAYLNIGFWWLNRV